jgi:integrase
MQFAIDAGIRTDNPALGVKCVKSKSDGFPTWEEHHIAAYEARHPLGTMPRLAFELALGTGQRRADLVKMGRQHVRGDMIAVRQQKTSKPLMIPIGNELRTAIDAMPVDRLTFITSARGEPFSPPSFTMWFRVQCQAAGLPVGYSVHGLYASLCAAGSPKLVAPKKRSARSLGIRHSGCSSTTPRPPTRRTWRELRLNASGTIRWLTLSAGLTHRPVTR